MRTINITGNPNAKLLQDAFPDLRMNTDELTIGEEVEIQSGKHFLGYAKVVAIKPIMFRQISNDIAFLVIGNNEVYLRSVLNKMYGNIQGDRYLFLTIFQWVKPLLQEQQQLFQRAWDAKKEKYTMLYRDLPENRNAQFAFNF